MKQNKATESSITYHRRARQPYIYYMFVLLLSGYKTYEHTAL